MQRAPVLKLALTFGLLVCMPAGSIGSSVLGESHKLPQDIGISGLELTLRKLQTTARLIHTTAHPDDEDGGMLTFESRGQGAEVVLLTLNRGEGGQNKTGSELFDSLGVLRTLELLAADQYYGVEQRFTRVADFGFSKTAEETFTQWHGHEIELADMVRVIRSFRPDVLVARFQGTARDGHGHHQASGILTREAFHAAADPSKFPEQIEAGLVPWQAKKLYMDNVRADEDYTLRIDTGAYDNALGESYIEFSLEGLQHQLSQGSGGVRVSPGHHYSYYKLLESKVTTFGIAGGHEQSFFDGIDTTLPGLAERLGAEQSKAPFLMPALVAIQDLASKALADLDPRSPERVAPYLLEGRKALENLTRQVEASSLSPVARIDLLTGLRTKRRQVETALNLALALELEVSVDAPPRRRQPADPTGFAQPQQTFLVAVPGQTFTLTARLHNRGKEVITKPAIQLDVPHDWRVTELKERSGSGENDDSGAQLKEEGKPLQPGDTGDVRFRVTVPQNAPYTRPYWHRSDPQTETVYSIDVPEDVTLPFPPYPVHATASYGAGSLKGEIESVARIKYIDPIYGQEQRPLAVGPPMSVELQPVGQLVAVNRKGEDVVTVGLRNNVTGPVKATLRLELPSGWRAEPESQPVAFAREGEFNSYKFKVTPGEIREGRYEVKAVAEYGGRKYGEGYKVVTRQDLGSFYYYYPAVQRVSAVAVKVPQGLKVGYIMGAGDEIPDSLAQLGLNVETISPADLATGNLSRFDTIVVGIRAYDVRQDVRDNNKRLLEYVAAGGTLIVQYNQAVASFNAGEYTPYPATATQLRVTAEEAPVDILAPQDSVFHYPNEINAHDFEGWVQERGTYFMGKWDEKYKPLLASHDPGEAPLAGGLLRATYGKGTYIYSGYAFFRQLPAGVPGAVRLFVNILSAGHEGK